MSQYVSINATIQPLREGVMYAYKLKFKEKFLSKEAWKEFNNLVYDRTMFTHATDHYKWHKDTIAINIIVLTAIREYACQMRPALRVPNTHYPRPHAKYMEKVLYEDNLVVNNKLQFETSVEKNEDHVAFILTRKWLYNVDFNEWKRRYGPLDKEILNELKYLRGVNGHLTRDKLPKAYISIEIINAPAVFEANKGEDKERRRIKREKECEA
jgi:hypothetical protein